MNTLPISITAEQASLSLIATDPDVLPHLSWSSDLFAMEQHKLIYNALEGVYKRTGTTNALAAISDLESTGKLNAAGGKELVFETLKTIFMAPGAMCVETANDYRNQLLKAKSYRDALKLWEENETEVINMTADLGSIAEQLNKSVGDHNEPKSLKQHLNELIDDLEEKNPIERFPLGLPRVDGYLKGGLKRGDVMVVGAQTSGGKSILLYQAALTQLLAEKSVVIFSLEMPCKSILQRMAANLVGKEIVSAREMARISNWSNVATNNELAMAIQKLMGMKLTLRDDLSDMSDIVAECMRLSSLNKADVIVIDYLQIVNTTKHDTREQAVAELSMKLKMIALKTQSVVMTATQLNTDGGCRESAAIGMNCDVLAIITHPDDKSKVKTKVSTSKIRLDKNRNGQRDVSVNVKMRGEISRFEEVE